MRRAPLLAAAWTAAAAAAVGLGFLAVSLVDASASPAGSFAGVTAAPTSATGSPATSSAAATGRRATAGGTVIADCSSGQPVLAGVPAAGWWSDDSAEAGKREFTNGSQRVEVRVTCVDGSPVFAVEGPSVVATSSTPAVVPSAPTTDDHGGLTGGHGGGGSGRHGGDG